MQFVRASMLIPRGFVANDAVNDMDGTLIATRPIGMTSLCPACGAISGRIHQPIFSASCGSANCGRKVRLELLARRFRCGAVLCRHRIFNERFDADVLAPWARRTARLDYIVHHLALALGGRPAASFARRLMLPVSSDISPTPRAQTWHSAPPSPTVVGIDDWRRNQRYGTIICDLERRKTIALLPDREPATAQAWLSGQPRIAVVARDRGGGYALAAQKALRRRFRSRIAGI